MSVFGTLVFNHHTTVGFTDTTFDCSHPRVLTPDAALSVGDNFAVGLHDSTALMSDIKSHVSASMLHSASLFACAAAWFAAS